MDYLFNVLVTAGTNPLVFIAVLFMFIYFLLKRNGVQLEWIKHIKHLSWGLVAISVVLALASPSHTPKNVAQRSATPSAQRESSSTIEDRSRQPKLNDAERQERVDSITNWRSQ